MGILRSGNGSPSPLIYRFGTAEFDPSLRMLVIDGAEQRLPKQAAQILLALLKKSPGTVTQQELWTLLWPDDPLADFDGYRLRTAVDRARDRLRPYDGYIRTETGVGYCFTGAVDEIRPGASDTAAAASQPVPTPPSKEPPSPPPIEAPVVENTSLPETEPAQTGPAEIRPAQIEVVEFEPRASRVRAVHAVVTLLALLIVTAAGTWWIQHQDTTPSPMTASTIATPIAGRTLLVLTLEGQRGPEIALALERTLAPRWKLLPGASQTHGGSNVGERLSEGYGADVVITGQTSRVGRYLSIRLFIHTEELTRHAWTEVLPHVASSSYIERRMQRAAAAMGLLDTSIEAYFPDGAAEQRFLIGHLHMDQAGTERTALRSLTELESAVRNSPRFAAAHAALCEALIRDSNRTLNLDRLGEAATSCRQALRLDPESAESLRTQAYLDRKRGDPDAAIRNATAAVQLNETDVDALLVLAEAYLLKHRNAPSEQYRQRALDSIDRAFTFDAGHWKTPFTRARVHFNSGEIQQAIDYQTRAVAIDANLQTLSNLGAFQFCSGDLVAARRNFLAAVAEEPSDHVANNQVATLQYQLRNFESAAQGFAHSIELHEAAGKPDRYELWGNLADALCFAGHEQRSIDAYRKALALVEKAVTKGDTDPLHRAHRVAFHAGVSRLDPGYLNKELRASLLRELDELAKSPDPSVALLAAMSHARLGNRHQALELRQRAAGNCPGYIDVPDFDRLMGGQRSAE